MLPLAIVLLMVIHTGLVTTTCTYPWGGGFWGDSLGRTTITFSTHTMQGYDLSYRGSSVTTWTCLIKDGDLILSRSLSVNVAGDDYYLYVCMLVNTVSSNKFYYHLMMGLDDSINKPRTADGVRAMYKLTTESVTDICTICAQNVNSISPPVTEFIVMTDDGSSTETNLISNPAFAQNPCNPTTTTTTPPTTTTTTTTTTTPTTTTPTTTTTTPTTTTPTTTTTTPTTTTPTTTTTTPTTTTPTTTTTTPTTTTTTPTTTSTTTPTTTTTTTTTTPTPTTTTPTPTTTTPTTTTTTPTTTTVTPQSTTAQSITPLITKLVDGSPWSQLSLTNIQFTTSEITGLSITIASQVQSNWTYVEDEPDLVLYRSDRRFNVEGQLKYAYLCMAITYTDTNHIYYQLWSERKLEYSPERVHYSVSHDATFAECCCPKYDIPSVNDYKVLWKPGPSTTIHTDVQSPRATLPKCYTEEDDNVMLFSIIFGIPAAAAILGVFVVIHNLVSPSQNNSSNKSSNGKQQSRPGSVRSNFGEIQV